LPGVPRRATIELRRSVWLAPFFEGLKIQNCWRDCQHLSKPAPPNILLGLHPDAVIEQAVTLAAQAVASVAKRITRLTNAFSKKLENLQAAVALHFARYNLVRVHKTLRVTPAMAANVTDRLWSLEELVEQTSK